MKNFTFKMINWRYRENDVTFLQILFFSGKLAFFYYCDFFFFSTFNLFYLAQLFTEFSFQNNNTLSQTLRITN